MLGGMAIPVAHNIATRLAYNVATGQGPSFPDLGHGINAILEGQVGWYEWWDARYGVGLADSSHVFNWKGQRRGRFLAAMSADYPEYVVLPGQFGDLPVVATNLLGGLQTPILAMPATMRPHMFLYLASASADAPSNGGARLTGGQSIMFDRDTTTLRTLGTHNVTVGNINTTSPNNSYTANVARFQEHFRDGGVAYNVVNGVVVQSVASTEDYAGAIDSFRLNAASTNGPKRHYAVVVIANQKIPDPVRAALYAYCTDAF